MSATAAALLAGTISILANMSVLELCDAAGVATAHGGLLQLLRQVVPLPQPNFGAKEAFHFATGLGLALFYAHILERRMPGSPLLKGLIYAAVVWVANAAVVLPLTGQGFAGARHLRMEGILLFLFAHSLFFVLLSLLYKSVRDIRISSIAPQTDRQAQ